MTNNYYILKNTNLHAKFLFNLDQYILQIVITSIFRHASVSRTPLCPSVCWSVSQSVTISDFQSLVSNGRSNHYFCSTSAALLQHLWMLCARLWMFCARLRMLCARLQMLCARLRCYAQCCGVYAQYYRCYAQCCGCFAQDC